LQTALSDAQRAEVAQVIACEPQSEFSNSSPGNVQMDVIEDCLRLSDMTLNELKKEAKRWGINIPSDWKAEKKHEIIKKIMTQNSLFNTNKLN